jgi:RNA:NAD 2'-phosphotransferase (TPT1/KptA family)
MASRRWRIYGTSKHVGREIIREGLRPMRSGKVHLSRSIQDAVQVGKAENFPPGDLETRYKKPHGRGNTD